MEKCLVKKTKTTTIILSEKEVILALNKAFSLAIPQYAEVEANICIENQIGIKFAYTED
jgi:hypothetical protein